MPHKAKETPLDTTEDVLLRWDTELSMARKREDDYRKTGERILGIYDGTHSEEVPFNILFSNTETLLPAIYSATPRPLVERRFKDADPLGKAAATASTRLLTFLVDTNLDGYETFDEGVTAATLNALLPGRGETRVKYDAELLDAPPSTPVPQEDDEAEDVEATPSTYTQSELICLESKDWNRVLYGYARKWTKVPWIAYEEYVDKTEAVRLFGKDMADRLTYTTEESREKGERRAKEERYQGERKVARIYQIWDKDGGRKVRYYSDQVKDAWLKELDDPLQLSGFYNCPRPLQFIKKTHSLTPTAPYTLYESQAKELNELTRRIKMVAKAIKAKGIYDSSLGADLKKLLEADDNELVPSDSTSSLAAEKGLSNAIWFMPLEQLIVVLTQLYQAREACKQTIYEITGISDILRGATAASETATAQTIKNQWGTLRLKRSQKEVARYARDLLRLMLELAATKFSEETWAAMTGLPYLLTTRVQALQQAMMAAQMQGNPQSMQQIQQQLQQPQWAQVLAVLQKDIDRAYRVDIETNSTVEPEATEDQRQISELFTAIGQFLNGAGPLVAEGVMPFQVAQSMLLTIVRRFRFGTEIEEMIQQMQPPAPKEEGQGQAQMKALQDQQKVATQQLQLQQQGAEMELKAKTMEAEKALLEKKIDLELREIQLKAEQDKFALSQEVDQQQNAMHDTVLKTREKMMGMKATKDGQVQQQQSSSQQWRAEMTAIEKTAQSVKQVASTLTALQQQTAMTQDLLSQLLVVAKAPRTKRAIRGQDGKIASVVEEVAS